MLPQIQVRGSIFADDAMSVGLFSSQNKRRDSNITYIGRFTFQLQILFREPG